MKKIDRIFCVSICDIISWMIINRLLFKKQQPRNFNIEAVEINICIIDLETVLVIYFLLFYIIYSTFSTQFSFN